MYGNYADDHQKTPKEDSETDKSSPKNCIKSDYHRLSLFYDASLIFFQTRPQKSYIFDIISELKIFRHFLAYCAYNLSH